MMALGGRSLSETSWGTQGRIFSWDLWLLKEAVLSDARIFLSVGRL